MLLNSMYLVTITIRNPVILQMTQNNSLYARQWKKVYWVRQFLREVRIEIRLANNITRVIV